MIETTLDSAAAAAGLIFAGLLAYSALREHRIRFRIAYGVIALLPLLIGGYFFWYLNRPLPDPVHETLFQGIDYTRDVRSTPRPLVIHIVKINLDTPGLRFFVTPVGENIPAQTVSQFLDQYHLQLAINADFFTPWHDSAPWDYYPHVGDPISTHGLAASEDKILTSGYGTPYDTLYINADNTVSFDQPHGDVYNAVSGLPFLLLDGNSLIEGTPADTYETNPRTAVGVDQSGRALILLLVDGRQSNYSEGVTLSELSALMLEFGAYQAINLDGGGSTTLVTQNADGTAQVLNSPIHTRIPGRERPVANQLGIYAPR
ncbi:MAG: phosphodiester glycosidase family protein [Chloroflexota bacterium]